MRPALRLTAALLAGWHVFPVVLGLAVTAVVVAVLPPLVSLPTVMSLSPVVSPPATLAALIVALLAVTTADEPSTQILATAPRIYRWANTVRVLVIAASGTAALTLVSGAPIVATASSVSALVGEGLLLGGAAGIRLAWALPMLHALASLTFGAVHRQDLAPWAWIVSPQPPFAGTVASLALLLIGTMVWSARLSRGDG